MKLGKDEFLVKRVSDAAIVKARFVKEILDDFGDFNLYFQTFDGLDFKDDDISSEKYSFAVTEQEQKNYVCTEN